MSKTTIEWTDVTWNPVRGCARVSPGCENCYAERQAHRFSAEGQPYEGLTVIGKRRPRWSGRARFVPEMLDAPLHWRKPRRVFVNSMSDLFHEDVTDEQIAAVFGVMAACPQHTFQVLTKRPERMKSWFDWVVRSSEQHGWLPTRRLMVEAADCLGNMPNGLTCWPLQNVWLGVSCEDQKRADERIPLLLQTPAAVRFVSAEPLLGPINLSTTLWPTDVTRITTHATGSVRYPKPEPRLDWVIVGGESGSSARACDVAWVKAIVDQCKTARVPVFVKQLGESFARDQPSWHTARRHDRKGGDPSEWPQELRIQQFPTEGTINV